MNINVKGPNLIKSIRKHKYLTLAGLLILILFGTWLISMDAQTRYESLLSIVVYDRNGVPLSVTENNKGHYVYESYEITKNFENLLLKKEDRFFYYHLGINPVSSLRALYNYLTIGRTGGSSTLTQQLAKNLLGTETNRNITNKLIEVFYAFSIEIFNTKEEILLMYANTVYLGNQIQGFETASQAYFNKPLSEITHSEQISLLTTLSHPSTRNPWADTDSKQAKYLNDNISPTTTFFPPVVTDSYSLQKATFFELRTAGVTCTETCITTIDSKITDAIRKILDRHINNGWSRNIRNGAIVVIHANDSELLSIVGSRDPSSEANGDQINMAIEPRPIGSTIKPFIYAKGFMEGLRPYTLVEDREYKYPIASGFSLYPKNYDGQYRGEITLHEALSNSLNVPSVKTLEYIGLPNFYTFLDEQLDFKPIQDYDNYQYGIALGGLEMDLLTLAHYFTIFPQKGYLHPLHILKGDTNNFSLPPQSEITDIQMVVPEKYIELVHAIISDRYTGVNQFGVKGNLNLTTQNYGVKTGTSRDFHDSWVIGYTKDMVVGVWLGNSKNEALMQVSGSSGAGAVWHDVMEYLISTEYNKDTSFTNNQLSRFFIDGNDEWGLQDDIVSEHRNLLKVDNLILSIHDGDKFELTKNISIPLKARRTVQWGVNGKIIEETKETTFHPDYAGRYEISAYDKEAEVREILVIEITLPE